MFPVSKSEEMEGGASSQVWALEAVYLNVWYEFKWQIMKKEILISEHFCHPYSKASPAHHKQ